MDTLGIIAGSGQFPALVADGARKRGAKVVICGFHGNTDPQLASCADTFTMVHLGQLGALIHFFKENGATHVCMAGAISKPRALDLRPDWRVAKLLFRLASNKGDDAILRAVSDELQSEGLTVIKPDSFVPTLKAPAGLLTKATLSEELLQDIRFGWNAVKHVGLLDIGQCVIVKSGIVVAVEAIEGTNAAIKRAAELAGAECTVIKAAKPHQDERLDLPSIGLETVSLLKQYKFSCLAWEADKTLFFDQQKSIDFANKNKIALLGIPPDHEAFFRTLK